MATILYAGAIGLILGLRGGVFSMFCGAWAILAVALLAFFSMPLDPLVLLAQTALALVSFNGFLMASLYGRYRLTARSGRTG